MENRELGIYIHIPFCKQKCYYCDFVSFSNKQNFVENYVEKAKDNYQIKFRNRGGIILPYIKYKMVDVNCRPIKRWPIHEIVIGPGLNQSKVIQSVKYFLEKKGMEDLADKVVASDIPYVET